MPHIGIHSTVPNLVDHFPFVCQNGCNLPNFPLAAVKSCNLITNVSPKDLRDLKHL